METPTNIRDIVEKDLLDLASIFCSLEGYGSPTSMRYSLFIQKDGTVGDETFSYQHEKPALPVTPMSRLRELGIIGLCTVHVQAESDRYYGIHLSISDPRFSPVPSSSGHPAAPSYYVSKVIRVMDDETGQPDFQNIQPVRQ